MMSPIWGMGGWMMVGTVVAAVLLVAAVTVAVLWLLRRGRVEERAVSTPDPREILDHRYVRGEIDDDEYIQRQSVLDSSTPTVRHERQRR